MTDAERALLRQDELEIEWRIEFVKEFKNENLELQIVIEQTYKDTNLLLSRLAAARAGEREILAKIRQSYICRADLPYYDKLITELFLVAEERERNQPVSGYHYQKESFGSGTANTLAMSKPEYGTCDLSHSEHLKTATECINWKPSQVLQSKPESLPPEQWMDKAANLIWCGGKLTPEAIKIIMAHCYTPVAAAHAQEIAKEKARHHIGGDIFEAERNRLTLNQAMELEYLNRAVAAEDALTFAKARIKELEAKDKAVWKLCKAIRTYFGGSVYATTIAAALAEVEAAGK